MSPEEHEDLYELLGTTKEATVAEIKKAYYKAALLWHPDRADNSSSREATQKFQKIGFAYSILSDSQKRKIYDNTGRVPQEGSAGDRDWAEYWRELFPKITVKDIQEFESKYKKSEEECRDLKDAYVAHRGDMEKILENVLLATAEDEDRFRELLTAAIQKGELKSYKKFMNEPPSKAKARKRRADKEAIEAKELADELGIENLKSNDDGSLRSLIQSRSKARMDDLISNLEAKYGPKQKKKR